MTKKVSSLIQSRCIRAARIHFVFAGLLALITIIFDAWNLITPSDILERWTIIIFLLIATTTVWFCSRLQGKSQIYYGTLAFCLIAADIALASFLVYDERGMASRSVMLYSVPIITAGLLRSRRATYATAAFATAVYTLTSIRYFVVNFNEGYKIELYGTIGFYSAIFFVLAALVNMLVSEKLED